MAGRGSLRAAFAHASHFMSQLPQGLTGLTGLSNWNPFDISKNQVANNPHSDLGKTEYSKHSGYSEYSEYSEYSDYSDYPLATLASSCPIDGPVSCHNETQADSCCFVHPGGRLLLTQFWDEKIHVGGAETDWTVHGLWPDRCDGSYDQYCGMAPKFDNITDVLESFGQRDLVEYMNRYWVAKYGTNDNLWAHEYNKHATCVNTLAPSCYGEHYKPGVEVVDYFVRAFALFRMLDTYRALERAGIEPDYHNTYPLSTIQTALETFSGGRVVLQCTGSHHNVLHEVWYVYFVQGSLQDGVFVPAKDNFNEDKGNCAAEVRYLPKRK